MDLRAAFFRAVAGTYCAHLEAGGDPGEVGIRFVGSDGRGRRRRPIGPRLAG